MKTHHAAQLATLVAAAGAFLAAALLTSEHQPLCNDKESESREAPSRRTVTSGSRLSPSVWMVSHGTSWTTQKHKTTRPQSITNHRGLKLSWAGLPTYPGLGATSASEGGGQGAGTTAALVAQLLAQVD